MTWLVDAGNTRIKISRIDASGNPAAPQKVEYVDMPAWVQTLDHDARIIISCVAANQHRAALQEHLPARSEWVQTPAEGLGIRCAYRDNRKWGVDRWLALAAVHANASAGKGSAVVDIGTATTFDICDSQGQHQGGWIAPGPLALLQALGNGRTSLPQAAADLPDELGLATDTEEALLHGALHCAVGSIRAASAAASLHGIDTLVIAGGGAPLLKPYLQGLQMHIETDLVLHGLALYAKRVEKPTQSA